MSTRGADSGVGAVVDPVRRRRRGRRQYRVLGAAARPHRDVDLAALEVLGRNPRRPGRQVESEGGALADLALDREPAAVQLDDLLGQGQADARAAEPALAARVGLGEAIEDARQVRGRDAHARVLDRHPGQAVADGEPHGDAAVRRSELERVGH
jgi:hypothetical protein